jgi:hypothetical protein
MVNYIVGSWKVVTKFGGKIDGIGHQKGHFLLRETPMEFSDWRAPYRPPAPAMGEAELKKLQDEAHALASDEVKKAMDEEAAKAKAAAEEEAKKKKRTGVEVCPGCRKTILSPS